MNPEKNLASSRAKKERATYRSFLAISALSALFLVAGIVLIPRISLAFWPFSPAEASTIAPVMHDTKMALLEPANNIDPNPFKSAGDIPTTEGSALIANVGPEGTAADVESMPSNGQISLYVVRVGDTLSEISDMFDVTSNTILWANNLKSGKDIHPGDTLLILPVSGIQHKVLKGETLATLAKKYGADAGDIASFNGIEGSSALAVGTTIIIPGGEITVAPAKTTTTKKSSGGKIANPYRGGSGAEIDGYYGNPVPGARLTQGIHGWNGVDLGAPSGTPIYGAADGTVIVAKSGGWNGGYGSYVVISHSNGTQTLYAHMSSVSAVLGQSVGRGTIIGYVGRTGSATGPHLHFEVRGARNPFAGCAAMTYCSPK